MRRYICAVGEITQLAENLPTLSRPAAAKPGKHVRLDPIAVREVRPSLTYDVERRSEIPSCRAAIEQLAASEVLRCRRQLVAAVSRVSIEAKLVDRHAQRRFDERTRADRQRRADDGFEARV